ncbi:MAG: hypothetical protein JXR03_07755 [Cyclobacteriaceae bacterium]
MKKVILTLSLVAITQLVKAQYKAPEEQAEVLPQFYLALSTGIDNYTGILGVGTQIPLDERFSIRAGVGLGAWGTKLSAGIKYENLAQKGVGFGLSYSHCTGIKDIDLELQDQNGDVRTINFDLLTVGSINATINKNWVFKNKNIFYLEGGYAFATGGGTFYKVNDGTVLNSNDQLILRIMRPGGLILSVGFLIGL